MITSLKNPRVAEALKLKKRGLREDRRRFLVEGPQAVAEALPPNGPGLEVLFHSPSAAVHPVLVRAREAGVRIVEAGEEVVAQLASTVTPQGLVGVAPFVDVRLDSLPEALSLVAVLCAVRDPGNAGTILRSADAAGADAVLFAGEAVDVYNGKVVRASAGSLFHLPFVRHVEVEEVAGALRQRGVAVYAMDARAERSLFELDLTLPSAFVFGNEAWGLPGDVAALADATVGIPIAGRAESLNVAAAASVCLLEAARQRSGGSTVSMTAVVSGAAHDVRSPLAALKAAATTLERRWPDLTDDQRGTLLRAVGGGVDRVDDGIRELVDAGRLLEGSLELNPEQVDLATLASEVLERLAADPDTPPVETDLARATVIADPARVRGAVRAMARAAAWWGREGPLRVGVRSDARSAIVEIRRASPEIGPGDAGQMFDPQAGAGKAGVRLGLFVGRGVARLHGGELSAEIGADVAFSLTLPVP